MPNYDTWKTTDKRDELEPDYEVCECRQCGEEFASYSPNEFLCGPQCEIDFFYNDESEGNEEIDFICQFVIGGI